MKTVSDTFKEIYGERFEVKIRSDGKRVYRNWTCTSICTNGIITDVGKRWSSQYTLVSADDLSVLSVHSYKNIKYESDHKSYAKEWGVDTVEDLIGLSNDDFYTKLKERSDNMKGMAINNQINKLSLIMCEINEHSNQDFDALINYKIVFEEAVNNELLTLKDLKEAVRSANAGDYNKAISCYAIANEKGRFEELQAEDKEDDLEEDELYP